MPCPMREPNNATSKWGKAFAVFNGLTMCEMQMPCPYIKMPSVQTGRQDGGATLERRHLGGPLVGRLADGGCRDDGAPNVAPSVQTGRQDGGATLVALRWWRYVGSAALFPYPHNRDFCAVGALN
ncbi:MAG: hypothetical protein KIH69_016390 [Anaerolineae bacterium]|nr:hypothetical protein [Anaerolineae bacterium]